MLKIKVLVDNNTIIDKYLTGEPGFSLWIETGGRKILFDTGYSEIFIRNASMLGLNVENIDTVVISHGHSDHTWGLIYLISHYDIREIKRRPELIAHPQMLDRKRSGGFDIGMILAREVLEEYFVTKLSAEPLRITDRLTWLGEIPRTVERSRAVGTRISGGAEADDDCMDDSALVYEGRSGLVIITGCSHSGICNIIDYARRLTGEERVADVIGGFHMLNMPDDRMNAVTDWLRQNPPLLMHPCHCTDLKAKIALSQAVPIEEVGVGLELVYD